MRPKFFRFNRIQHVHRVRFVTEPKAASVIWLNRTALPSHQHSQSPVRASSASSKKRPSRMTTIRLPTRTPLPGSGMPALCSKTDSRHMNKNTGNDECRNGLVSRRWHSGDYLAGRSSSASVGTLCAIDNP